MKFDQEYCLDMFRKLVAVDSTTGQYEEIQRVLCEVLDGLGYRHELTRKGGVIADAGGEGDPIAVTAHLDDIGLMVRKINALEQDINEKYGVRMIAGHIPGMIGDATGEVTVRRGMEEIEKALGKEAKIEPYFPNTKILRVYGIEFRQYADDRTKTFVKAGKESPKVQIVEDD